MNRISFKWIGMFLVALLFSCPSVYPNTRTTSNHNGIGKTNISAVTDTSHMKSKGMKKSSGGTKDSTKAHKKAKGPKGSPYDTTMTPKKNKNS